jgi:hypothetical protein
MQQSGTTASLKDFAWACVRLGRYHTLMGLAASSLFLYIFSLNVSGQIRHIHGANECVPATPPHLVALLVTKFRIVLTVALYHAAHPSVANLWRAVDLMLRVFICTLAYRGVGVVVDVRIRYLLLL